MDKFKFNDFRKANNITIYILIGFTIFFIVTTACVAITSAVLTDAKFSNIVSFWSFVIATPITAASALVALILAKRSLDISGQQNLQNEINNQLMTVSVESQIFESLRLEVERVRSYHDELHQLFSVLLLHNCNIYRGLKEGVSIRALQSEYAASINVRERIKTNISNFDQYSLLVFSWNAKRLENQLIYQQFSQLLTNRLEMVFLSDEQVSTNISPKNFKSLLHEISMNEIECGLCGAELGSIDLVSLLFGDLKYVFGGYNQMPGYNLFSFSQPALNSGSKDELRNFSPFTHNFNSLYSPENPSYRETPIDLTMPIMHIFEESFLDRRTLRAFIKENFDLQPQSCDRLTNMLLSKDFAKLPNHNTSFIAYPSFQDERTQKLLELASHKLAIDLDLSVTPTYTPSDE
ncbi:hypothetical protein ACPV5U_24300 [Vibrio mediterranei]